MSDIDETLKERGATYGNFESNAQISTDLFNIVIQNNKNLDCIHLEALKMICHKMARILNGDPNFKDSWTDIIGYARLVEKEIEIQTELAKTALNLLDGDDIPF